MANEAEAIKSFEDWSNYMRLAVMANESSKLELRLAAIDSFKDWSNYMLITTVAAIGWVTTTKWSAPSHGHNTAEVIFLALSAIFGIFTLALVPIVTECLTEDKSIYEVEAKYKLFYLSGPKVPSTLKIFCWPQHFFLILAIATQAYIYWRFALPFVPEPVLHGPAAASLSTVH
jgi:hypothetical protein